MKKTGFTLAEVLITLGIIGVVAALTTPALNSSFQKNKVGPTLRKIVSTMEVANEHILAEQETNTLTSSVNSINEYLEVLSKYVIGTPRYKSADKSQIMTVEELTLKPKNYSGGDSNTVYNMDTLYIYDLEGGESLGISLADRADVTSATRDNAVGTYKGNVGALYVDINGFDTKPNRLGKDIFHFNIDDSGSIVPDGSKKKCNAYLDSGCFQKTPTWEDSTWNQCDEENVGAGHSCAGSIADNGWKVIYKY